MKIRIMVLFIFLMSCSHVEYTFTPYETNYYDEESGEFIKITRSRSNDGIVMPYPIGGTTGIAKNIKYPMEAYKEKVVGRVLAVCFVDENGVVQKVEISEGLGYGCDKAAIEVLYKTKFLPGLKDGKPVKIKVTVPIRFNWAEKGKKDLN